MIVGILVLAAFIFVAGLLAGEQLEQRREWKRRTGH